ncbi:hypothetical protein [Massilia sp. ZL223]|uniref:hypothetical protein n=1 Tax=Massilia sp. ZL223 TaxID=2824904 RepID=UPI001B817A04|nr:hypothetical protein [Massilia sp. ZL223]MBQ5965251.1 hypothetical protein [Massilia sp. ZL223]
MRRQLTFAVALATGLMLAWQHLTTGVPAHHLLARADMPAISNWWGVILLPLLAWVAASRVEARYGAKKAFAAAPGFAGGLLFGAAVALFFSLGRTDLCEYLMQGLLLLAFFYPIYRSETLLGFAFGMSYAFGPVLPVLVACVLAVGGYVLYQLPRVLWSAVKAQKR